MKFERAVALILKLEGGYVNDPNDPGGETNFGISKRSYPYVDIKNLTQEQAIEIYKKDYWEALNIQVMPEQIRFIVFDCAINQGKGFAQMALQRSVGVSPDGHLGPITFKAFDESPIGLIFSNFAMLRHKRYSESSRWEIYGKGWTHRLLYVVLESNELI